MSHAARETTSQTRTNLLALHGDIQIEFVNHPGRRWFMVRGPRATLTVCKPNRWAPYDVAPVGDRNIAQIAFLPDALALAARNASNHPYGAIAIPSPREHVATGPVALAPSPAHV